MSSSLDTTVDEQIAQELRQRLPARLFDAHAHFYTAADMDIPLNDFFATWREKVTVPVWREMMGRLFGESRMQGALCIPVPLVSSDQLLRINQQHLQEITGIPCCKGLVLVAPTSSVTEFEGYLSNPQFAGFKPYHSYSTTQPTFQAAMEDFIPEWVWEFADAHGLAITLHMVRDKALADAGNQQTIRTMCRKYPNARLILAHAARGFHAPNTVEGIKALDGLQNVWFDTSAICEPEAYVAILRHFGPRKLMWGSDFPVSEMRGKAITAGDNFVWVYDHSLDWTALNPACRPTLIGLESMRALLQAADYCCLNEEDLQDICADNALRLLGMKQESGTVTQDTYAHAKQRMPGGVQLLSKRPEMLAPEQWPAYFREARGCEVWDMDGRHYYDMYTNGIGACLLGYADPDVTRAVTRRINLGSMSSLNPPEEVELADELCEIHPWAEKVRFARCGGETATIAVRIARATTDRSVVAVCGYHGWHDWYLAANLGENDSLRGHLLPGLDPLGVPTELRGTTAAFTYENYEQFDAMLKQYGDRLAAVIMEPCRYQDPKPGFLEYVRDGAHRCGALLIFDEITIGWRLNFGGSHLKFGVNPDLAIYAKALGNGHPIGAVIGTAEAMAGTESSFISSTYWTESVGPVAGLATLKKFRQQDVPAYVAHIGGRVKQYWRQAAAAHKLPVISDDGYPCLAHFRFDHPDADALRTLYTQLMLQRGFLAGVLIYPTLAHTDEIVDRYGEAIDDVFGVIADALSTDSVKARLAGPVAHNGFRRLL